MSILKKKYHNANLGIEVQKVLLPLPYLLDLLEARGPNTKPDGLENHKDLRQIKGEAKK